MPKDELVGFVGMSTKDIASLDGIPFHVCGAIMVRAEEQWLCLDCGATTGCTEPEGK